MLAVMSLAFLTFVSKMVCSGNLQSKTNGIPAWSEYFYKVLVKFHKVVYDTLFFILVSKIKFYF